MITYTIDGCNEMFLTLQEAKKHIWLAYTPKECIKELTDTCIVGWKDGEVHSFDEMKDIRKELNRFVPKIEIWLLPLPMCEALYI